MAIVLLLLGVVIVVTSMDLTIKRVYRYPKQPHETTPAAFGISFEEVRFPTRNNCLLYGWCIPAQDGPSGPKPAVILAHGWGRNLERLMPYVRALHVLGCNLLAFDLRSHGSSDRDSYPNLLKFSQDIRAAVDFVMDHTSEEPTAIGVVGLSIGGGAAIHAAAADDRIQGVVAVGALAHPADVMRWEFTKRGVPYYPAGWLMLKYLQLRMGVNFNRIAPASVIQNAAARILLIHGEQDAVVPLAHGRRLLRAGKGETTRLWVVPDKGHSDCHEHPEFWNTVGSFLQETDPIAHR